jgi:hypothetical protein
MTGDCHVRFCERVGLQCPALLDYAAGLCVRVLVPGYALPALVRVLTNQPLLPACEANAHSPLTIHH